MINELHIGDVNKDWSAYKLKLIDKSNFDKIVNQPIEYNCYTSAEDLGYETIETACWSADKIFVYSIDIHKEPNSNSLYGRLFNELRKHQHKIQNTVSWPNIQLDHFTRPQGQLLWTFGCSAVIGTGIEPHQRWTKILADRLGRQEVCRAKLQSSILSAADRILRSDLCADDVVIWGLAPTNHRVNVADKWNFQSVHYIRDYKTLPREKRYWNLDYFNSETHALEIMHAIGQVQNFCAKVKVKFFLFNSQDTGWVDYFCQQYTNYINLSKNTRMKDGVMPYLDYGTDGIHAGPVQNQVWADDAYQIIKDQIG